MDIWIYTSDEDRVDLEEIRRAVEAAGYHVRTVQWGE